MKKEFLQQHRKFAMVVALLCLTALMPAMVQAKTVVNVTDQTATITQSSTLYVGEVVLNGHQAFCYMYSEDLTNSDYVFAAVRSCLSVVNDGKYSALVPDIIGTSDNKGIKVCSNTDFTENMNSDWTSAANAGQACLSYTDFSSSSSNDLYQTNADFAAKCDNRFSGEDWDIVDNAGHAWIYSGILGELSATNTDNVTYTVVDNELVKHIDRKVDYTCENVTVIYTKAEYSSPLTFEAVEAGSINIYNPNALTIEYNKNSSDWTSASDNTISIAVEANDVVLFRGNNACYWAIGDSGEEVTRFTATNDVYVSGNVMSLIDKENYATNTTLTDEFALAYLFTAPSSSMFEFYAKNNTIKNHPSKDIALPATTLTETCYGYMFAGCEGLTRAPELPATTLAMGCYHQMFADCSSLTTAPELPAATLADVCYSSMFYNCSSLNKVKCLATDFSAVDPTFGWMDGVASTGTFIKAEIADYPRNEHGIPAGWTVETEDGVGTTATLTANADDAGNYWTTYYNGLASVAADEHATVYTAKVSDDKTQVALTEVTDGIIPAGNAVVMKSSVGTITLTTTDATGTLEDNDLLGQSASFDTPDNLFALVKGNSGVGFYRYPTTYGGYATQFPAQKAYLIVGGTALARTFMPFGNESTTGIISTTNYTNADDAWYTVDGRKLYGKPAKPGIYVNSGSKIIIK